MGGGRRSLLPTFRLAPALRGKQTSGVIEHIVYYSPTKRKAGGGVHLERVREDGKYDKCLFIALGRPEKSNHVIARQDILDSSTWRKKEEK